jgi:hypothetical protein
VPERNLSKGLLQYEIDVAQITERIKQGEILSLEQILDELTLAINRNLPDMTEDEAEHFRARATDVHMVVPEQTHPATALPPASSSSKLHKEPTVRLSSGLRSIGTSFARWSG